MLASVVGFLASGVALFSLGFWVTPASALSRQLWELLVTFTLYPDSLFGGPLRLVLFTVLPAGILGFWPVRLLREPSLMHAAGLVVAVGLYTALAVTVFHRGLRRYASGSRFGTFG